MQAANALTSRQAARQPTRQCGKEHLMASAGSVSLTRRCFFTAAGLAMAAPAVGRAQAASSTTDLPKGALLGDGDVKTYLLVFRTGQEVMKGLLAFARKHGLTAGHLTGI